MTTRRWSAVVLVLIAACAVTAQQPGLEPGVQAVLAGPLRFSAGELAELRRGEVVRHGLPGRASGEIAVAGGVGVRAPKAAFFAHARDIARFKSGPAVLQIGRFSTPPVLEDLAALTVDRDDFDVRACRLHDCGVRLPAAVIERIGRDIDVTAPDAQARGAALFKQVLLDHVTAYLSGGPGLMTQYDDGERPIRPQEEFEGTLAGMPEIGALLQGLPDHLRHLASSRLPEAEDFLYWSKEKFGLAPFITVTHVTIVCRSAATCLMTTRDVYSSRYLDASVALAIASDLGGTPGAFALVYTNRSRANALKGALGVLRRTLAERRARGGLEDSLGVIKKQLEKD
jgi:hypothetical protein